jgi:hypothetical protein
VDRNQFSLRLKTDKKEEKTEARENSLNKFLSKIWTKVTSPRPESLKVKEDSHSRKKDMKNYLG